MSDQPLPTNTPVVPTPQPATPSAVDDVVELGSDIRDLYAQADAQVDPGQSPSGDSRHTPLANTPPVSTTDFPEIPVDNTENLLNQTDNPISSPAGKKSPLDLLEEILGTQSSDISDLETENLDEEETQSDENSLQSKDEQSKVDQLQRQLEEQKQQSMIEEHRRKLQSETSSDEQKKRDAIRQQQIDANKVENPFEIRQLQRKTVYGGNE